MSMINVNLFNQVLPLIDRDAFKRIVSDHDTNKHSKAINNWTHLVSMLFMHLDKTNSNRDLSNGLRSATGNLNHIGLSRAPSKSSMSYIQRQ